MLSNCNFVIHDKFSIEKKVCDVVEVENPDEFELSSKSISSIIHFNYGWLEEDRTKHRAAIVTEKTLDRLEGERKGTWRSFTTRVMSIHWYSTKTPPVQSTPLMTALAVQKR
ncbi:hypothetical protein V6N13_147397 [Hibiscus sabdariffa]